MFRTKPKFSTGAIKSNIRSIQVAPRSPVSPSFTCSHARIVWARAPTFNKHLVPFASKNSESDSDSFIYITSMTLTAIHRTRTHAIKCGRIEQSENKQQTHTQHEQQHILIHCHSKIYAFFFSLVVDVFVHSFVASFKSVH